MKLFKKIIQEQQEHVPTYKLLRPAVKYPDGHVATGARGKDHSEIRADNAHKYDHREGEAGFWHPKEKRFLSRSEAAKHAPRQGSSGESTEMLTYDEKERRKNRQKKDTSSRGSMSAADLVSDVVRAHRASKYGAPNEYRFEETIADVIRRVILEKFRETTPRQFTAGRDTSKRGSFLTHSKPSELTHHKMFTDNGGKTGYALDKHGDLQNVYNNANKRGAGQDALKHAIKSGAKTLDAFDGHLTKLYKRHGFIETGRLKFNRDHAPKDWDYKKHGEPDVVMMAYRGGNRADIDKKTVKTYTRKQEDGVPSRFAPSPKGRYHDSYEDAKRHQTNIARGIDVMSKQRPLKEEKEQLVFNESVLQQLPEGAQKWINGLGPESRKSMEHTLNLIGVKNFAETWEFQKEEYEYYLNF